MINVPNWDERKEHYEDYWQLKNKRAVIHLCAPLEGGNYDYPPPPSSEDFWFNPRWGVGSARHGMENTYFGLDAYPNVALSIGPDLIPGIIGMELCYNETSEWVVHSDKPLSEFRGFPYSKDNFYYQTMKHIVEVYTEDAKNGDYIVGTVDMNTLMDGLAGLIGPEQLCYELLDNPDDVKRVMKDHLELFKDIYTQYYEITTRYQKGNTNWLSVYSEKPAYFISNDFEVMMSADAFDEFCREPIAEMARFCGRVLFHLDGENVVRHLPALNAIPELTGIQVQATPYQQSAAFWIPHIKTIQAAGKSTWVEARNGAEVLELIQNLRPEGLFIKAWAETEKEAHEIEERVDAYYRGKE